MAKIATGLPRHVRRFCDDELFAYRKVLLALEEIQAEHDDVLREGGNLGHLNPVGRVNGGPIKGSPTYSYAARREALQSGAKTQALLRRKARVEKVLDQFCSEDYYILRCYYYHGMKPDEVCQAGGPGWNEEALFELRAYAMTLLALEWEMI